MQNIHENGHHRKCSDNSMRHRLVTMSAIMKIPIIYSMYISFDYKRKPHISMSFLVQFHIQWNLR